METKQNSFVDRQRLAVSKSGAKSSNVNEDSERPLTTVRGVLSTTLKDHQRLAVIPSDPNTPTLGSLRFHYVGGDAPEFFVNDHPESQHIIQNPNISPRIPGNSTRGKLPNKFNARQTSFLYWRMAFWRGNS